MNGLQATIAGGRYGSLTVLGQVDLSVAASQTVVLLGSNGAGKTTALRAIMGTVATGTRTLRIDGRDVTSLPTWRLAQAGIVMVPDGARCFPNLSVRENLLGAYTATHARRDAMQFERLYREVVGFFPILDERAEQLSGTMSGGQRQMLAVCRALMAEPRVLLLDEPSAGLAPIIAEALFEALLEIQRARQCAVILAEQNAGYVQPFGGHCIVLAEGEVALQGTMQTVLADERLRMAYLGL